jgi:Ni/Fe-hydrogenase subunit HybB-like protein
LYAMFVVAWFGIGTWGLDKTVGWGLDITNFVWWVGIGHAGTFISAILLLFRQKWRTSVNRASEAMTIFAIMCAGLFPLIHMGRIPLGFFIFPYPNTRDVWVNFNSPLLWDVFALTAYILVSLMFWFMGLIPDFATIRDKAQAGLKKQIYRFLSFGWTGSAKHWARYESMNQVLAGVTTALVIAVCSIVSFDFATSVIPGWHATVFPLYFFTGAIFCGFAMALFLLVLTRKALNLQDYITVNHIELMNKIVIVMGSVVAIIYTTELFMAWYSGSVYEQYTFMNRAFGPYKWVYWTMMTFNLLVPQLFWFKKLRRNLVVTVIFAVFINIGMWCERFIIIVTSLHRDFLPSSWTLYIPTWVEVATFTGTLGLFFMLYFLFIRFIPVVAIAEVKSVLKSSDPSRAEH